MPVMGGYEATANLLAIDPDLPIIGQTAHAYGEEKDRCFAVGMVDHIAKPLNPDLLVEKILTHARKHQA
jgi:CheY-like chemotaxis protein